MREGCSLKTPLCSLVCGEESRRRGGQGGTRPERAGDDRHELFGRGIAEKQWGWAAGSETPRVGLNGRSGRPKTREAAEERPHNQGDETNPIVSAGRTFGGFLPKKKPAQSGAGRVGSVKAATGPLLKHETRREGTRAYFCILIITGIL